MHHHVGLCPTGELDCLQDMPGVHRALAMFKACRGHMGPHTMLPHELSQLGLQAPVGCHLDR